MSQLTLTLEIAVEKEIEGVAMGVLKDGTPYIYGRGLAKMCGVAASAIIQQEDAWAKGPGRSNKLGQLIITKHGYTAPLLYVEAKRDGRTVHAYTDKVCIAFLEYYGFQAGRHCTEKARDNLLLLAGKSLKDFIYAAVGYSPPAARPAGVRADDGWSHIKYRLLANPAPHGYFSVLQASAPFLLDVARAGLELDHTTVPDGSIGIRWRTKWETEDLSSQFGDSAWGRHNYPPESPQSRSNPQPIHIYPIRCQGVFLEWLYDEYIPLHFKPYLSGKVADKAITAERARKLLDAIDPVKSRPLPSPAPPPRPKKPKGLPPRSSR